MKNTFDYTKALQKASKGHRVYVIPLKKDGTKDYSKGHYVVKPEEFKFCIPYRKRSGRFEGNRKRHTFNPVTGEAYSYGHWRFVWKVRNTYIFNTYSYSHTTSGHQCNIGRLLRQLGIKNVFRVNLGSSGTIDNVYARLYQAEIEQNRKGAKSRASSINAEKRAIEKLRALGFKPVKNLKDLKADLVATENRRLQRMLDAKTERKRLRDLIKTIEKSDPKDLSPQVMIKETNAEVRRMLFNKIGGERVLRELNARTLDTKDNYKLVSLDLGLPMQDNPMGRWEPLRPYLTMVNPSTGETHVEGVPSHIITVVDALAWRNGLTQWVEPLKLT